MKKRLYMLSLWTAIFMLLLSTVVPHHHHLHQACIIGEKCLMDGKINDRHTSHSENEDSPCIVQQMHVFVVDSKIIQCIFKSLKPHVSFLFAVLVSEIIYCHELVGNVIAKLDVPTVLVKANIIRESRRGPPCN